MRPVCQLMIFLHFILLRHIFKLKKNLMIKLSGLFIGKVRRTLTVTNETRHSLLNTKSIQIYMSFVNVYKCVCVCTSCPFSFEGGIRI